MADLESKTWAKLLGFYSDAQIKTWVIVPAWVWKISVNLFPKGHLVFETFSELLLNCKKNLQPRCWIYNCEDLMKISFKSHTNSHVYNLLTQSTMLVLNMWTYFPSLSWNYHISMVEQQRNGPCTKMRLCHIYTDGTTKRKTQPFPGLDTGWALTAKRHCMLQPDKPYNYVSAGIHTNSHSAGTTKPPFRHAKLYIPAQEAGQEGKHLQAINAES